MFARHAGSVGSSVRVRLARPMLVCKYCMPRLQPIRLVQSEERSHGMVMLDARCPRHGTVRFERGEVVTAWADRSADEIEKMNAEERERERERERARERKREQRTKRRITE